MFKPKFPLISLFLLISFVGCKKKDNDNPSPSRPCEFYIESEIDGQKINRYYRKLYIDSTGYGNSACKSSSKPDSISLSIHIATPLTNTAMTEAASRIPFRTKILSSPLFGAEGFEFRFDYYNYASFNNYSSVAEEDEKGEYYNEITKLDFKGIKNGVSTWEITGNFRTRTTSAWGPQGKIAVGQYKLSTSFWAK